MPLPLLPLVAIGAQLAPEIGRWLFGKTGEQVGSAVTDVVQVITGTSDPEKAREALADPEIATRLRIELARIALQAEENARLAELELAKTEVEDRINARNALKEDSWTPRILAFLVILTWASMNAYVMFYGLPYGVSEIVSRALGGLDALLLMIFSFYFGSSLGSKSKDKLK